MIETYPNATIKETEPQKCVFCEIVSGDKPASIITENDSALAIISLEGHVIVIPKKHIDQNNIAESLKELGQVYELGLSLVPSIKSALQSAGISVYMAIGEAAGQEIAHLHAHFIQRNPRDKKVLIQLNNVDHQIREAIAAKIRASLADAKAN